MNIFDSIWVATVSKNTEERPLSVWMLSECWGCVCISGCVKLGVKSYCVKVQAADPGPVVTVAWSFVGGPSTVNLLHSPLTKGCFHLWLLGGGVCATESTMRGAGPCRPLWILSQAGRADDTGNSGDSFVIPVKCRDIFAPQWRNSLQDVQSCHDNHVIQQAGNVLELKACLSIL